MDRLKGKNGQGKNCIVAKTFLDTNILVYTLDQNRPEKQKAAKELFKTIGNNGKPVISTQVLREFYSAAVTKLHADKLLAKRILHNFGNMEVVQVNIDIIEQGIDISILELFNNFSY